LIKATEQECFKRCIFQPAGSLSTSEQACVSACVDKYWHTFDVVAQSWNKSVASMRDGGGGFLSS